jgi:hypothetical protein
MCRNLCTYTWPAWYRQFMHIYMTCLVESINTHIHDLFGTGNLYTYTWPVWYRLFIKIYMTCLALAIYTHIHDLFDTGNFFMYICINFLYQTGHVYVYKLPVPNSSYTWPVCYRQFMHIYMTCLVEPINTHIHDLFGTGSL